MTIAAPGTLPILDEAHAHVLSSLAMANVLLAFDYDGTLAPIAPTPAAARMRAGTRALLRQVAGSYPAVVISGRALDDIAGRLRGIPLWHIFGNHGAEPALPSDTRLQRSRTWANALERALSGVSGVVIEDKGHSVTVHYRAASDGAAARDRIRQTAARLPDARIVGGKKAINLLHRDAPNKGFALEYAMRAFACDMALYVGDDETDEDAFGCAAGPRLVSVRVGAGVSTRARFHVRDQKEIDELLQRLIQLRAPMPVAIDDRRPVRRR